MPKCVDPEVERMQRTFTNAPVDERRIDAEREYLLPGDDPVLPRPDSCQHPPGWSRSTCHIDADLLHPDHAGEPVTSRRTDLRGYVPRGARQRAESTSVENVDDDPAVVPRAGGAGDGADGVGDPATAADHLSLIHI